MARVTRRFLVTGRVQGVYFRQSARFEAERLGIDGLARNLPDGSVEVVAQGAEAAVESLHEWLHRGPPAARVASVTELELLELAPGVAGEHHRLATFKIL
ncbi:MAG: acylphosphatase [Pseudomonadota bacterium]|nr:acylphosphatase [Pseudomonadota bacterium]